MNTYQAYTKARDSYLAMVGFHGAEAAITAMVEAEASQAYDAWQAEDFAT